MDWIILSNWWLGSVVLVFAINAYFRIRWDLVWSEETKGVKIPERRLFYDAQDLEKFVDTAKKVHIGKQSALAYYVGMLKGPDTFFAVALSLLTAYIWYQVAIAPEPWPWLSGYSPPLLARIWPCLNWIALPGIGFAILYGVADVAEDWRLASILWHAGKLGDGDSDPPGSSGNEAKADEGRRTRVDRADASAANALTRIKIAALAMSGVGLVIFLLIGGVHELIKLVRWAYRWAYQVLLAFVAKWRRAKSSSGA